MARLNARWLNFWSRGQAWWHFWQDATDATAPEAHTGAFAGAEGLAGSASSGKAALGSANAVVGDASSEASQKQALGTWASAVGASGSEVGSQSDGNVTSGAVGVAGSAAASKQALGDTSGAVGMTGASTSAAARAGAWSGAEGLAGSAQGASIQVALGSFSGAEGDSGSAEGVAGAARAEGATGPRKTGRRPRPLFVRAYTGSFSGDALSTRGHMRGAAGLAAELLAPEARITEVPLRGAAFDRAALEQLIRELGLELERAEAEASPELLGHWRGVALGATAAFQGLRFEHIEPEAPPAPREELPDLPPPQPAPEPVLARAEGRWGGALSVVSGGHGAAYRPGNYPAETDELELMMIIDLALHDDEEAA